MLSILFPAQKQHRNCPFHVSGLLVTGTSLTAPEIKSLSFYQQNRFSKGVRNVSFPPPPLLQQYASTLTQKNVSKGKGIC